ncbi:DUF192 domain-containing protein [Bdellovibrio sp. 22V]|uniref:DUF192 domain-containing protein n=1 Tax=Bdellovibrio TaxID=958 RepID=UPI00254348E8|nr:DUF192 domain-containing protein [Bdellovibrio sp. 22V]WII72963.1 DUF192 domain-containing protein [Bdellovibrio sp. 22V]
MGLLLKCLKNKWAFVFTVLFASFVVFSANAADFQKKTIKLGAKTLVVEVAETPDQHERGLMFRDKLPENEGMLFIFKNEETRFFWMKNTLIDLSIAYFDKNGTLIDIQEMKSGKGVPEAALPSYPSAKPAKYALEMSKGWFDKNKIKIGSKLKVP